MTPTAQSTKKIIDRSAFIKNVTKDFTFGKNVFLSHDDVMEEFACDLFSIDNNQEDKDFNDILEILDTLEVSSVDVATKVSEQYVNVYVSHFPEAQTDADFIFYTEELIQYVFNNSVY